MPRRRRIDLPGIPQHVVQRANNRGVCSFANDDRHAYLDRLAHHAAKLTIDVHAYGLMTNHVHLLLTPQRHGAVSALMQDLGRDYVQLVDAAYKRSGTLWEGRFHSCLIDSERYLLTCMRYIELNPVRASIVDKPEHYAWSSYRSNAFGRQNLMLTAHPTYRALGAHAQERCAAYRAMFAAALDSDDVHALRQHTQQRAAWGTVRFQQEIAAALGRPVAAVPRGRPPRTPVNGI